MPKGKKSTIDVVIEDDIISINEKGQEIAMWIKDEWVDDPNVVFSIANAIKLAYTNIEKLKEKLNTFL